MSQRVTDVMVVEGHAVFRQGIVSCLDGFDGIGRVESVASIAEVWSHPALGEADVVLLDAMLDGAGDFVAGVLEFTATRVVALAGKDHVERLAALVAAGAVVTRDCEPNGLYVGVPARRVRNLPGDSGPEPTAAAGVVGSGGTRLPAR